MLLVHLLENVERLIHVACIEAHVEPPHLSAADGDTGGAMHRSDEATLLVTLAESLQSLAVPDDLLEPPLKAVAVVQVAAEIVDLREVVRSR